MERHGDPERWENEFHQALKSEETEILRILRVQPGDGGVTSHDLVHRFGYSKSHRSCWGWLMKLCRRGLLERGIGGSMAYFYITEYGRWMTRYEDPPDRKMTPGPLPPRGGEALSDRLPWRLPPGEG